MYHVLKLHLTCNLRLYVYNLVSFFLDDVLLAD